MRQWFVIIFPCRWYLLLTHKSPFVPGHFLGRQIIPWLLTNENECILHYSYVFCRICFRNTSHMWLCWCHDPQLLFNSGPVIPICMRKKYSRIIMICDKFCWTNGLEHVACTTWIVLVRLQRGNKQLVFCAGKKTTDSINDQAGHLQLFLSNMYNLTHCDLVKPYGGIYIYICIYIYIYISVMVYIHGVYMPRVFKTNVILHLLKKILHTMLLKNNLIYFYMEWTMYE